MIVDRNRNTSLKISMRYLKAKRRTPTNSQTLRRVRGVNFRYNTWGSKSVCQEIVVRRRQRWWLGGFCPVKNRFESGMPQIFRLWRHAGTRLWNIRSTVTTVLQKNEFSIFQEINSPNTLHDCHLECPGMGWVIHWHTAQNLSLHRFYNLEAIGTISFLLSAQEMPVGDCGRVLRYLWSVIVVREIWSWCRLSSLHEISKVGFRCVC